MPRNVVHVVIVYLIQGVVVLGDAPQAVSSDRNQTATQWCSRTICSRALEGPVFRIAEQDDGQNLGRADRPAFPI